MARKAPATDAMWRRTALVLCGHGIRGGIGVAATHAERISACARFAEVRSCVLKGRPGLVETVQAVRAAEIMLAPLLMAEGHTLQTMLRALDGATHHRTSVTVCRPLGVHPRLGEMIAAKARALCAAKGWRAAETGLLVVGHGTSRHPDSAASARRHASQIVARGDFAEVTVGFLDERPYVAEALQGLRAPRCAAVGLFVDAGEHGEEDVPALLAPAGARAAYAGPIGPDPLITELILDQVHAALDASMAA